MGNFENESLSKGLEKLGFHMVTGTTEYPGNSLAQAQVVRGGTPKTMDHNNGTQVVYDESGNAWIRRWKELTSAQRGDFYSLTVGCKVGAYVPHSNGCGWPCQVPREDSRRVHVTIVRGC
jgi:hypothetical protein